MTLIKVKPSPLPPESALWPRVGPQDFLDCFTVRANTPPRVAPEIKTEFTTKAQGQLHNRRKLHGRICTMPADDCTSLQSCHFTF